MQLLPCGRVFASSSAARRGAALGLALFSWASASASQPEPRASATLGLSWSGESEETGCLGATALSRAVEAYLERPIFSSRNPEIRLDVRAEPAPPNGYRSIITIVRTDSGEVLGTRELTVEGKSCSSLNEPLKLVVALMVDGEPGTLATRRKPKAAPPPDAGAPKAPPPEAAPLALRAELAVLAQAVLLPRPGPGLAFAFGWDFSRFVAARAELGAFLPTAAQVAAPASADVSLLYAGLGVCPGFDVDARLRLEACALGLVASSGVTTRGMDENRRSSSTMFGASLGLHGSTRLAENVGATASLRGLAFPSSPRFVYRLDGTERELFRPGPLAAVASLGLSVRF
jgi:hypothetical protein